MRHLLDALALLLAVALGLPIYLALLPYLPAAGSIFLGAMLVGVPAAFRRAHQSSQVDVNVPDYPPPSW